MNRAQLQSSCPEPSADLANKSADQGNLVTSLQQSTGVALSVVHPTVEEEETGPSPDTEMRSTHLQTAEWAHREAGVAGSWTATAPPLHFSFQNKILISLKETNAKRDVLQSFL